jgi:hypothetical protein
MVDRTADLQLGGPLQDEGPFVLGLAEIDGTVELAAQHLAHFEARA